jgi:hypothetical protein
LYQQLKQEIMNEEIKEFAILNLESKGITAKQENSTVYVCIGDNELELSEFEINFQASEWDKKISK